MKLVIDQEVAQALLNYLVKQPYSDVFNFVNHLTQLKPILAPVPVPDPSPAPKPPLPTEP